MKPIAFMRSEINFDDMSREVLNDPDARAAAKENCVRHKLGALFTDYMRQSGLLPLDLARKTSLSISQVNRLLQLEVGGNLTLFTICRVADELNLEISLNISPKRS